MSGRYHFEDETPSRAPALVAVTCTAVVFLTLALAVMLANRRSPEPSKPQTSRLPPVAEQPADPDPPRPKVVVARPDPPAVNRPVEPPTPEPPTLVEPRPAVERPALPEIPRFPTLEPGRLVYGDYHLNKIKGFSVYISRTVFSEARRSDDRPLDCLQDELEHVSRLEPRIVKAMQTIKVFVEWDHVEVGYRDSVAVFYGGRGEGFLARGVAPFKAGQVTILSLKRIAAAKARHANRKGIVILHEMAHAAHHYDLGDNNPFVRNAYEQAMTRRLYKEVPDDVRGFVRAYAATNEHEYFAEITCAYLDYCDYYPHDRQSLREYDSVGYELMRKVWGDPPADK